MSEFDELRLASAGSLWAVDVSTYARRFSGLLLMSCLMSLTSASQAAPGPACPADSTAPYPAFGQVGEAPQVASWSELEHLPANCHVDLQGPAALTIALAGRFAHSGTVEEVAARFGAISATRDLPYWSVSDEGWRPLVSDAFALESLDTDSVRADFSGQEVLSGKTLSFAQNDTRSWGLNVYSIRAIHSSEDQLILTSANLTPVRLGPVTLFEADDVHSVLFIERQDDTAWTYFNLTLIKRGNKLAAREKSLINRQAAFFWLLIGQAPDQGPPLAP